MSRVRLAFFIVFTVAAMAWLVARVRADEPLYFPTVGIAPKIEPTRLVNSSEKPNSSIRDVVLIVPNFPCGACQWLEGQLNAVPGIRVRKVVDMTRPSWPWLSVPDTGHEWAYPITAGQVVGILKAYPPKAKQPAKAGPTN